MDNAGPGHPPLAPLRHPPRHVTNALFFPSFDGFGLERATPAALARVHQDVEQTVEPSGRSAWPRDCRISGIADRQTTLDNRYFEKDARAHLETSTAFQGDGLAATGGLMLGSGGGGIPPRRSSQQQQQEQQQQQLQGRSGSAWAVATAVEVVAAVGASLLQLFCLCYYK
jgi:hypothetical protein